MKHENLSVTALVEELTKLSAVAVLAATTTLSVAAYNSQDDIDHSVEVIHQVQSATTSIEMETHEETSPAKTRDLLEYIQRFESTGATKSQGVQSAYQVVYGGISTADRPLVVLTHMTVSEVLAWQDRIDPRYRSEAAGAYQVMEDTLRGLVNSGHVDPNAMFDEATQDAVALLLIERRGLSKFVAGKMSAEEFADNLAREWASFPVVRDQKGASRYVKRGQSYYAGDGLNKAHADPDEFLNMVKGILKVPSTSTKEMEVVNTDVLEQAQSEPEQRETSADVAKAGTVTLSATKPIDGSIKIDGQIGLANYHDWNITTNAEYEFETDTYKIGGSATYEKDDLLFTFSGAHDSDDNTEFKAEMTYRF
jgi:muramidase (phage lysozyme)